MKSYISNSNLFLSPTNESEISNILSGLKRTSAPGHDGITLSDLLNIKDIIIEVVVNLVNNILSSGKFPSELKIVKICPIHKNGPKFQMTNYRPISLVSVFSKIIENVMKIRMLSFISSNTLSATMDLMDHLASNLDREK